MPEQEKIIEKQSSPDSEKYIVCPSCNWTNDSEKTFCKKCGANLKNTSTNSQNTAAVNSTNVVQPKIHAVNKNPTVAILLSIFFPGVGQLYNGDTTKGIVLLLIWLILGAPTLGLIWVACWIYGLIDAYDVASGKKTIGTL